MATRRRISPTEQPAPKKRKPTADAAAAPIPSHTNGDGRLTGTAYLEIMGLLGHDHRRMADALGVTKWCSIAWKSGRRRIPPLAETALRGLLLKRFAGDIAAREVDRVIDRLKA